MKNIPPLVGHRGASHLAPENTLPSYRLAYKEGADRIEGDFWLTLDQQIVCIHDPTTARTAPGQPVVDVRQTNLDILRSYDVGSWKSAEYRKTGIPTLPEILAELPPAITMYIEIKQDNPEIISGIFSAAESCGVALEQLTLISFSENIIQQSKKLAPGLTANLLHDFDDLNGGEPGEDYFDRIIDKAVSIDADGLGVENSAAVNALFVQKIRNAGLGFHVWTVNSADDAMRFISLGVDSITTDRPGELRKEIEARLHK